MEDRYEVRLYNTEGLLKHVFDSWSSLSVDFRLNDFSTHTLSFPSTDTRVRDFDKDAIIEVRRKNDLIDWHTVYTGFHRTPRYQVTATGLQIFTSYGRSLEDLLARRVLAYASPHNPNGNATSVLRGIVEENLGPNAIAGIYGDPRFASGVQVGFTTGAHGPGPIWDAERSGKEMLGVLTEIANTMGCDFNVIWVPPADFRFETYFPQMGVDRTQTTGEFPLLFGVNLGNVSSLDYTVSATEEKNKIFLISAPTDAEKTAFPLIKSYLRFTSATGAINDSPWNMREMLRDVGEDLTYASIAQNELRKNAAIPALSLDIAQTPTCMFGKDYFLGDLVSVIVPPLNHLIDIKITGYRITEAGDTHTLDFSFGELAPSDSKNPFQLIGQSFRNVIRRLIDLEAIQHK